MSRHLEPRRAAHTVSPSVTTASEIIAPTVAIDAVAPQ
jgi:hypothetical protein